jgi:DNA-binding PadR family transcriptional regulator
MEVRIAPEIRELFPRDGRRLSRHLADAVADGYVESHRRDGILCYRLSPAGRELVNAWAEDMDAAILAELEEEDERDPDRS